MRIRVTGFITLLSVAAVVAAACSSHKLEPPSGLTNQQANEAGNGLGGDVESGANQFGTTQGAAFAPVFPVNVAELSGWLAMVSSMHPSVPSPPASGTDTPLPTDTPCTVATTTVPFASCSPTPTPSAAPSVTPPASATPTPGSCAGSLATITSSVDADADTFPDAGASATLDACELSSGLGGVAATGSLSVVDDSASNPAFAFQRVFDIGITEDQASGSIQSTVTGSVVTSGVYAIQQNADLKATSGGVSLEHKVDWQLTYTPSSAWSAPWPLQPGTLDVEGSWSVNLGDASADATISTTTPILVVDSATCPTRVVSGSLEAIYVVKTKAHTVDVTWTGCGARTVARDGTPAN